MASLQVPIHRMARTQRRLPRQRAPVHPLPPLPSASDHSEQCLVFDRISLSDSASKSTRSAPPSQLGDSSDNSHALSDQQSLIRWRELQKYGGPYLQDDHIKIVIGRWYTCPEWIPATYHARFRRKGYLVEIRPMEIISRRMRWTKLRLETWWFEPISGEQGKLDNDLEGWFPSHCIDLRSFAKAEVQDAENSGRWAKAMWISCCYS